MERKKMKEPMNAALGRGGTEANPSPWNSLDTKPSARKRKGMGTNTDKLERILRNERTETESGKVHE